MRANVYGQLAPVVLVFPVFPVELLLEPPDEHAATASSGSARSNARTFLLVCIFPPREFRADQFQRRPSRPGPTPPDAVRSGVTGSEGGVSRLWRHSVQERCGSLLAHSVQGRR